VSNLFVVVGGQYGSEAKGHVTAKFVQKCLDEGSTAVINVRVAGPNAGHTVYDAKGNKFAFRQVPVGAVLGDNVLSVIAAGSEVEPEVLFKEIAELKAAGHYVRLYVDQNATLIEEHHKEAEADAELVKRIGSTGKGIGAARQARLARTARRVQDDQFLVHRLESLGAFVVDTKVFLRRWLQEEKLAVIVEGTQGFGLGLHTESYPQVTSSDCTAVDFLAMAGISPWAPGITKVMTVVVCRVYPIRVAGNSGPMQGETTWEALGLPEERTTVTQKVRRVGQWDARLVREAVLANGGGDWDDSVVVALTMADQKVPEFANFEHCEPGTCTGHPEIPEGSFEKLNALCRQVQEDAGAPVVLVTTGPATGVWV
jgi:adenylosuccinate synthase